MTEALSEISHFMNNSRLAAKESATQRKSLARSWMQAAGSEQQAAENVAEQSWRKTNNIFSSLNS